MDLAAIIENIKSQLNGERDHDMDILTNASEEYRHHPNAHEILREIGRLTYDLLSDESKAEFEELLNEDFEAIIAAVREIVQIHEGGKLKEALAQLEPLTNSLADKYGPGSGTRYLSFSNPHEEIVYRNLYDEKDDINHLPVDLAHIFFILGNYLFEDNRIEDAFEAFTRARYFNPAKADILERLCDCAIRMKDKESFEEYTRALHKVAFSRYFLSICYMNFAMILIDKGHVPEAGQVLRFAQAYSGNRMIDTLIEHVESLQKEPVPALDVPMLEQVCKDYDIPLGPDQDNLDLTYTFAKTIQSVSPELAIQMLAALYDITYDEDVLENLNNLVTIIKANEEDSENGEEEEISDEEDAEDDDEESDEEDDEDEEDSEDDEDEEDSEDDDEDFEEDDDEASDEDEDEA